MSAFGCHNCGVDLSQYKDKPWDEIPCSKCKLGNNYYKVFSTGFFDTGPGDGMDDQGDGDEATGPLDPYEFPDDAPFVHLDDISLDEDSLQTLKTIKKAIEKQLYYMLSGIVIKLLKYSRENPIMFEIMLKKIRFPYMSYSEIGNSMTPKCSKQNVLYHLKHAVAQFPELVAVIHTDTRYTAGKYALKSIADKARVDQAEQRLLQIMYGDLALNTRSDTEKLDELNHILHMPCMVDEDVFKFNHYIQDEIEDQKDRDADNDELLRLMEESDKENAGDE